MVLFSLGYLEDGLGFLDIEVLRELFSGRDDLALVTLRQKIS